MISNLSIHAHATFDCFLGAFFKREKKWNELFPRFFDAEKEFLNFK